MADLIADRGQVHAQQTTRRPPALFIRRIEQDGPAALAGLQEGDIILAVEDQPVLGVDDLVRLLNGDRIGKPTELLILPIGNGLETRAVTPAARP